MTIKELEQRTGLPRTSVRFYEQEGFLHPERRENNYRDYSEEDARTLKKIKLLRQLSLDLDAIRRLQAGELSLSQALAGQARALEGDRADLERYAQVCQELSRTETSYGELDPEPWLAALEEKSLPLSRRVDPAKQDAIAAAPYPWRRFFARALDWALAAILWTAFRLLALRWDWAGWGADALYGYADAASLWLGGWLVLLILEPILLCTWGYTPGKWLLRLRVRRGGRGQADLAAGTAAHRFRVAAGDRAGDSPAESAESGRRVCRLSEGQGAALGPGAGVHRPPGGGGAHRGLCAGGAPAVGRPPAGPD